MSGCLAHRATRSARPAITPAWGPPRSLSVLNVTRAAPAASVWRAAGSSRSQAGGGPPSQGHAGIDQSGADVGHDGHLESGELGDRRLLREPFDAEIGRVHLEDERGVGGHRLGVVREPRAVGGPDVDQPGARLGQDVGHPEAAADLDALAPSDEHVASDGEGGENQQHGSGVVVDDDGRLGPGESAEQAPDRGLTGSPPAGREIELDVHRRRSGTRR